MRMISLTNRAPPRENQDGPLIRNHGFRRNPLQIKQREQRGKIDQQQTIPPL